MADIPCANKKKYFNMYLQFQSTQLTSLLKKVKFLQNPRTTCFCFCSTGRCLGFSVATENPARLLTFLCFCFWRRQRRLLCLVDGWGFSDWPGCPYRTNDGQFHTVSHCSNQ